MRERYLDAAHAMQSGVAAEMNFNPKPTEPKHLRTGINAAMVDHAGLVRLLIDKGVFTEAEYIEAITGEMKREVGSYEARLKAHYGANFKLV